MGLFGKIFSGITGKPERSQQEIAFEKSVIKDGVEYAGKRVARRTRAATATPAASGRANPAPAPARRCPHRQA